jgi:putative membrane fusion protein
VTPLIEGFGKDTVVVRYEEFPVQDTVTGIFVREETLYTAAYAGAPQYMVSEGTKIRAGTQVVYIDPDAAPPAAEPDALGEVQTADSAGDTDVVEDAGPKVPTLAEVMQSAAGNTTLSEGGVSPTTAIVSYYADGFEKRINPGSIETLGRTMIETLPDLALDIERDWTNAGEPLYKIMNNNIWRFVFWLPEKTEGAAKRYVPGADVTLDLGTTKVTAVLESVNSQGDDLFVVLRSDMYYRDLDKYRKQEVHIIFNIYHGAVIDRKAVLERAGVPGVYVRQQSGIFKWVPIRIVRESEGRLLIAETSYEDVLGGRISTVRYYDEIMSDPAAEGY